MSSNNNMIVHERPTAHMRPMSQQSSIVFTPRFDICQTDEAFFLIGDMPGVAAEDVDIRYENKTLTIWGKVAPRNEGVSHWAKEYGVGDYYRTFQLSDGIDAAAMEAELKNGVLTVRLPKRADARPARVTVRGG
jgi:HSP20 family molecular chaperone IbpA